MKLICLIGQDDWAKFLVSLLNRHGDGRLEAFSLSSLKEAPQMLKADLLMRVGFRPGAPTSRGVAFDLAWSSIQLFAPQVKMAYYWIGSDVLHTLEDFGRTKLKPYFFKSAKRDFHLAGAPWLADELSLVGIDARSILFPSSFPNIEKLPNLPEKFTVLSYLPDLRPDFYGAESIVATAKQLPEIEFHTVGGTGSWLSNPPENLFFHGWQSEMLPFYESSSAVIRMVRHDAIGGTVREALALARHAIYSYPLPHTQHVAFGDTEGLISAIKLLYSQHNRGVLPLNLAGRQYALDTFDENRTTELLIEALLEACQN